jgi:hypothetical protein
MTRLSDIEEALVSLNALVQVEHKESKENDPTWAISRREQLTKWSKASSGFDESRLFLAAVCGNDTAQAYEEFGTFGLMIASKLSAEKDVEVYRKSYGELYKRHLAVRAAVRNQLGIEI